MLDCLGVAGIECQIMLLLQHLDRRRIEPYLCLLRGEDEHSRQFAEVDGRPILRLGVRSLRHPSTLRKAIEFGRFLRRERIDVLHPLFPDSLYFGTPIARLTGVPRVVRFRVDLNWWMKPKDRWLGRILSTVLDATVANCEASKRVAVEHEWALPETIEIISNGVDLSRFPESECRRYGDPTSHETRVGVVANLRPVKNLDLLVRAAALLKPSHPNVRYQIAGEGTCRSDLELLIGEYGLQNCFDLLGTVADIPAFLRTLDVAVLCSKSEGSPNSIMEYMAAGLPIVATDVGGCGELITHDQHGLLMPAGDASQLAVAIDRLLRDPGLSRQLGTNARHRAFAEFGVDRQARRYEEFYEQLYLTTKGKPLSSLRRDEAVPRDIDMECGTPRSMCGTTENT
ncbi:MAG TPA: glycosyltransferase [Pirellulales bacterium]|jgi:glycosyltransferase involved in cell wall biosynthesis